MEPLTRLGVNITPEMIKNKLNTYFKEDITRGNDKDYTLGQYLFWEDYWQKEDVSFYSNSQSDSFIDMNTFSSDSNVLEVGSGDGRITQLLVRHFNNVNIIEQSYNAWFKLCENFSNNHIDIKKLIFEIDCIYKLPYKDNSFDIIFCIDVLNHLIDWTKVINEFSRVLKNGGILIVNSISSNDSSYQSYESRVGNGVLRINKMIYVDVNPLNKDHPIEKLIMHYSTKEEIENTFLQKFKIKEVIIEYQRQDPAHELPFLNRTHEHKFWKIVAINK